MAVGERLSEQPRSGLRPPELPAPLPLTPQQVVLAAHRAYGNRVVARALRRYLARDPLTKDPPQTNLAGPRTPWVAQTTYANQALAKEIDALENLDDKALRELRDQLALKASIRADTKHEQYEMALRAAEFLTARRDIAPLADRYSVYDDARTRRRNVRALIEQGIRQTGSLEEATEGMTVNRDIKDDVDFFKGEAKVFGEEFTRQAREIGNKMLDASRDHILDVIETYGLKAGYAMTARDQILRGEDREDVVKQVVENETYWTPDPASTKDADPKTWGAPRKWRVSLAVYVRKLKRQQEVVNQRWKEANAYVKHSTQLMDHVEDSDKPAWEAAMRHVRAAQADLAAMWAQSERVHPALAAFRGGESNLEKVDLDALDDARHGSVPQMAALLSNLLQKLVDVRRAQARMTYGGDLNPLSLPPVVAVAKAAMFVPPGSIRDGKVNDLVAAAHDKSIAKYIAEGLIALIALAAVLPTGGASLGLAIGLTGAALSATSAVEDWETYQRQKMLVNTSLDRAQALATEEPSLLPFAVDLISLGLDGLPLVKAFNETVQLRNLYRAEASIENTKRINQIVDHLNEVGAAKGDAKLGAKARQAAEEDAAKTSKPKPRDKLEEVDDRVKVSNKQPSKTTTKTKTGPKGKEAEEAKTGQGERPTGAAKVRVKPTAPPREARALDPGGARKIYQNETEMRSGVRKALGDAVAASKKFNSGRLTTNFSKLKDALKAKDPAFAERFAEYFHAIDDSAFMEEKMVKLWKLARDDQVVVAEKLEQLLAPGGDVNKLYTTGLEDDVADAVFKAGMKDKRPMVDLNFASDYHGTHTHMFEQWIGDELWGAGEGAAFRRQLADEPNYKELWDVLFDANLGDGLHRPETLGQILQEHADFPRFQYP